MNELSLVDVIVKFLNEKYPEIAKKITLQEVLDFVTSYTSQRT